MRLHIDDGEFYAVPRDRLAQAPEYVGGVVGFRKDMGHLDGEPRFFYSRDIGERNYPSLPGLVPILIRYVFQPRLIPVEKGRVDMPLAPAEETVERARLARCQVCPAENPADEDHRVLALEFRMVDFVEVAVDMAVQVSHIRW